MHGETMNFVTYFLYST